MKDNSMHQQKAKQRRHAIQSFKAKANARRTLAEKFADWLTGFFGSILFLVLNAAWFLIWIAINTYLIPGVAAFDPFPFGLLTMVVSLEAIFLAIIVLISQNREARVAELREEVDLQINTIAEAEVLKSIKMLTLLLEKNGISVKDDEELQAMLTPATSEEIEKQLVDQL